MSTRLTYPPTPARPEREERAGVAFVDPYRWLEGDSAEVRAWQRDQAALAAAYARQWPHYEALRTEVDRLTLNRSPAPRLAAGLLFRAEPGMGRAHACATVSKMPAGEQRMLFDPASEDSARPGFISWISPSPDGRTLALGVCSDGSEKNTIRLVDVETGTLLAAPPHVLMDGWLGGAHWLADSNGFFFTALIGPAQDFRQAVFRWRLSEAAHDGPESIAFRDDRDYRGVTVSACGRWATAFHRILTPIPVALLDLVDAEAKWRPFVTELDGMLAGPIVQDRLLALTYVGAARGRVVAIALDSQTPGDPASWQEIVPESKAVIRSIARVGERLYLHELADTYSRVRSVDFGGREWGEVPLPDRGAVAEDPFPMMALFARDPAEAYVCAHSSFTRASAIIAHRPGAAAIEILSESKARLDGAIVEDRSARAHDGTFIPYQVVRMASLEPGRPRPTLIYAYGAGGAAIPNQFLGPIAAFVAAGGVYIHAHLRGGGEYGLDWWAAGVLANRQTSYDDLSAVAEDLIADGEASPETLGVTGGSAGGLMTGAAITQRPDLWRVAVPRVPVLDLIGGLRDPYIAYVARLEWGDFDDPGEVRRIATFSPYQLVRDGVRYPAVYIDAGDTDPRCAPWHARKFAARLQAAQSAAAPILLHVWENSGHGWATPRSIQVEENAEWLAFVMRELDLEPKGEPRDR